MEWPSVLSANLSFFGFGECMTRMRHGLHEFHLMLCATQLLVFVEKKTLQNKSAIFTMIP